MPHPRERPERDAVVVGAGLSGLIAATELVDAGLDVVVVEAAPRVGGRLCAVELDGGRFDVGGQWIGGDHERMLALVERLGLESAPRARSSTPSEVRFRDLA